MNMGATLLKHGLPVTLIPDTAVATIMSTVDLVMVGAEAVVENGGIINKVCHACGFCYFILFYIH
jgi:translation initiation factor eIF-2B subunit alpha